MAVGQARRQGGEACIRTVRPSQGSGSGEVWHRVFRREAARVTPRPGPGTAHGELLGSRGRGRTAQRPARDGPLERRELTSTVHPPSGAFRGSAAWPSTQQSSSSSAVSGECTGDSSPWTTLQQAGCSSSQSCRRTFVAGPNQEELTEIQQLADALPNINQGSRPTHRPSGTDAEPQAMAAVRHPNLHEPGTAIFKPPAGGEPWRRRTAGSARCTSTPVPLSSLFPPQQQ